MHDHSSCSRTWFIAQKGHERVIVCAWERAGGEHTAVRGVSNRPRSGASHGGREGRRQEHPRSTLFEAGGASERGTGSVNIGWRASQANLFLFLGIAALARDGRAGGAAAGAAGVGALRCGGREGAAEMQGRQRRSASSSLFFASQRHCMDSSTEPKTPSETAGMSSNSSLSRSDRSVRLSQHARSCSTMVAMLWHGDRDRSQQGCPRRPWDHRDRANSPQFSLVRGKQGEHIERSSVQCCRLVRAFGECRLEPVHLRREGGATGGKRGSPGMMVGSHMSFHRRHPQKSHALYVLAV